MRWLISVYTVQRFSSDVTGASSRQQLLFQMCSSVKFCLFPLILFSYLLPLNLSQKYVIEIGYHGVLFSCGSCLDNQNVQQHEKTSERCLDIISLSDHHILSSSCESCENNNSKVNLGFYSIFRVSEVWHVVILCVEVYEIYLATFVSFFCLSGI